MFRFAVVAMACAAVAGSWCGKYAGSLKSAGIQPSSRESRSAATKLPEITAEGINRAIAQLNKDLKTVKKSDANSHLKRRIESRIVSIQNTLRAAAAEESIHLEGWNSLKEEFVELASLLKEANLDGDTGACDYQGGCIVTTKIQCADLGGIFFPGQPCLGCLARE